MDRAKMLSTFLFLILTWITFKQKVINSSSWKLLSKVFKLLKKWIDVYKVFVYLELKDEY